MRKTFKYRIYPTKQQARKLNNSLDLCRQVYNQTLDLRKTEWEQNQKSLSLYDTNKYLKTWKESKPELKEVFSQCLQNAQLRVDLAFKAFFRRVKAGEKRGYPRFKGKNRYDSLTYPQLGFKVTGNRLFLSKIGNVDIVLHRPLPPIVKNVTIKRTATKKWFVSFSCVVDPVPLPASDKAIGIDVGLTSFATYSDGTKVQNPRFFKSEQKALAKAQRKKKKQVVARIYERISNKRSDFSHKLSRTLINNYGTVVFEDLNIKNMVRNSWLAKSIHDVAWGQLVQFTVHKAEEAGRRVILVDPRGTSQKCSRCDTIVPKDLSVKIHHCHVCSLSLDRDHNAAINILALGLQCLRVKPYRSPRL